MEFLCGYSNLIGRKLSVSYGVTNCDVTSIRTVCSEIELYCNVCVLVSMNYFLSIALSISGYDILPLIFRMIDANKPSRSYCTFMCGSLHIKLKIAPILNLVNASKR